MGRFVSVACRAHVSGEAARSPSVGHHVRRGSPDPAETTSGEAAHSSSVERGAADAAWPPSPLTSSGVTFSGASFSGAAFSASTAGAATSGSADCGGSGDGQSPRGDPIPGSAVPGVRGWKRFAIARGGPNRRLRGRLRPH